MFSSQYSTLSDPLHEQPLQILPGNSDDYNTMMMPTTYPQELSQNFLARDNNHVDPSIPNRLLLQQEKRARFMVRLSIVLKRLKLLEEQNSGLKLTNKVKSVIRYATQRNRLGDPRFSPLVDTIETYLKDLLGCEEWFSVCLEAQQRSRIRKLSNMIMSSSTSSPLASSIQSKLARHELNSSPRTTQFQTSFFPDCHQI